MKDSLQSLGSGLRVYRLGWETAPSPSFLDMLQIPNKNLDTKVHLHSPEEPPTLKGHRDVVAVGNAPEFPGSRTPVDRGRLLGDIRYVWLGRDVNSGRVLYPLVEE